MNNEFEVVMSKRTDAELLEILNAPVDNYQPLAIEAAKIEFAKRNLSDEQLQSAKNVIENKQREEEARQNDQGACDAP